MTLEAVLFLLFGYAGATLLGSNLISPYFAHGGGLLWFHLWALVSWIVFVTVGQGETASAARRRFVIVLVSVAVVVVGSTLRQVHLRQPNGPPRGIHDGAVQTEVAADFFLRGHNPYQADYRFTSYGAINPPIPGGPAMNVVWSHYIYPPLTFLFQTPFTLLAQGFRQTPDMRWLLLGALALSSWLVVRMTKDWDRRTLFLLLTVGNPFIWLYVVAGYNDILVVTAFIAVAAAWRMKRWVLVGVAFGLAVGLKQSAWVALPLFALALWRRDRNDRYKAWRAFVITTAAVFVPFMLWNTPALYDDIVRYGSGVIPYSYPISGSTFIQYLPVFGLVPSVWSIVPTYWGQLIIGVPVFLALARWFRRDTNPDVWLTAVSILTLAVLLVSRYNNNNYLSGLLLLSVAAYAFRQITHER